MDRSRSVCSIAAFRRLTSRRRGPNWGISGSQTVRDLWQQKDLGTFDRTFTAKVPAHGAVMLS
jgi:hypothetical protein